MTGLNALSGGVLTQNYASTPTTKTDNTFILNVASPTSNLPNGYQFESYSNANSISTSAALPVVIATKPYNNNTTTNDTSNNANKNAKQQHRKSESELNTYRITSNVNLLNTTNTSTNKFSTSPENKSFNANATNASNNIGQPNFSNSAAHNVKNFTFSPILPVKSKSKF